MSTSPPLIHLFFVILSAFSVCGYLLEELSFSDVASDVEDASIFGDFVVVGTDSFSFGAATIFHLNQTTHAWYELDQVAEDLSRYGTHVSLSKTNLLVSGRYTQDEARVYELNETSQAWVQTSDFELTHSISSVVIGDKYLVAGDASDCHDKGSFSGCVHVSMKQVNERNGTITWKQLDRVYASDANGYHYFGASIDMWHDKFFIVGADMSDDHNKNGGAYIFEIIESEKNDTVDIVEVQRLQPKDSDADNIGSAVAIFDKFAAVVAHGDSIDDYWSVYFYERDDTTGHWNETTRFFGTTPYARSPSVALFNNYCIVGNRFYNSYQGEVIILHRSHATGTWEQIHNITNETGPLNDNFGQIVAIHSDHAIVSNGEQVYIISDFKPDDISSAPTSLPTNRPSETPTIKPTSNPSENPTIKPSEHPSQQPSLQPTAEPTDDHVTSLSATLSSILTSTDAPNEPVAAADNVNRDCNNDKTEDLIIVTLVCLAGMLACINIAMLGYFCRRTTHVHVDKENLVNGSHGEAGAQTVGNNKNRASIADLARVSTARGMEGAVDTVGVGVHATAGQTGQIGQVGQNDSNNNNRDDLKDVDELFVMMTKHGEDHVDRILQVMDNDEELYADGYADGYTATGRAGNVNGDGMTGMATNAGQISGEKMDGMDGENVTGSNLQEF